MPFQEGQDPDLDTTDNIDPNAGYQPPDTEGPEPMPPPDDYSDPKVGGLIPEDLPGARSLGYYFDKAGNRQQVTDTANPTINYVINPINQYSSVSGSSISNGNEHEVYSFQGLYDTIPVNYYYVNDEHLKQVSDGTYNRYFFYDALGRCVKRRPTTTDTGNTTYYIYDGDKPILKYSSTGIVGRNVYGKGIDEILMRTDPGVNNGQPIYYAQDHEGSVTHLINGCTTPSSQTGNVLEKYAYDAFGVPTFMDSNGNNLNPNASAYNNRFLFTGREYAATYRGTYVSTFSFYEYRARAYNPNLGRFMSEDPKGFVRRINLGAAPSDWSFSLHPEEAEFNLFRYCGNNPIDFTDPMGLEVTLTDAQSNPLKGEQLKQAQQQYNIARAQATTNRDGTINKTAAQAFSNVEASKTLHMNIAITNDRNYDSHQIGISGIVKNGQFEGNINVKWNPLLARANNNDTKNSPAGVLVHEMWHAAGMLTNPRFTAHAMQGTTRAGMPPKTGNPEERRVLNLEGTVFPNLNHEGVRTDLGYHNFLSVSSPAEGGHE